MPHRPEPSDAPNYTSTALLTSATVQHHYGMNWNGGDKYNVVGYIGKGAFAMVYKVATKRDGEVFAVKQIDKRKFIKDGVLDHKVNNELEIIKHVRHVSSSSDASGQADADIAKHCSVRRLPRPEILSVHHHGICSLWRTLQLHESTRPDARALSQVRLKADAQRFRLSTQTQNYSPRHQAGQHLDCLQRPLHRQALRLWSLQSCERYRDISENILWYTAVLCA